MGRMGHVRDAGAFKKARLQHIVYNQRETTTKCGTNFMMSVLPLAKIVIVITPIMWKEAKIPVLTHIPIPDRHGKSGVVNGLWTFEGKPTNFAEALWRGGNSWIHLIVIRNLSTLLEIWPENDSRFAVLYYLCWNVKWKALTRSCNTCDGLWIPCGYSKLLFRKPPLPPGFALRHL